MGKYVAWFFAAAIVIGACNNLLETMSDPTTTTVATSTTSTAPAPPDSTIPSFQEPPVSDGGTGLGGAGSPDPSDDEIDCGSPEDAIDAGWDEEDVLDFCGMDDSELGPEYQD